jgi:hypothetical protein
LAGDGVPSVDAARGSAFFLGGILPFRTTAF